MYAYGKLVVALVLTMCFVRGGLAAWFYLFPAAAFAAFGMPQEPTSIANYLVRVWAGRDVVIALLVATAGRAYLKPLLIACVAIDCSDLLAATLAHSAGIFSAEQLLAQFATVIPALVPETIALALVVRVDAARSGAIGQHNPVLLHHRQGVALGHFPPITPPASPPPAASVYIATVTGSQICYRSTVAIARPKRAFRGDER